MLKWSNLRIWLQELRLLPAQYNSVLLHVVHISHNHFHSCAFTQSVAFVLLLRTAINLAHQPLDKQSQPSYLYLYQS